MLLSCSHITSYSHTAACFVNEYELLVGRCTVCNSVHCRLIVWMFFVSCIICAKESGYSRIMNDLSLLDSDASAFHIGIFLVMREWHFLHRFHRLATFHHPSPLHSFIPGLKLSYSATPSHRSLPFLLQDWLHGFPRLFSDTSQHIRFYFLVFVFYFLVVGPVR